MSDYERRITTKERGSRHNKGKRRPSLIPWEWTEELIMVMEAGAQKYGTDNWEKGMPYKEVLDCLERHLLDFKKGIDIDPDDGLSTITKVAVNALFLRYYQLNCDKEFDNRRKHDSKQATSSDNVSIPLSVWEGNGKS